VWHCDTQPEPVRFFVPAKRTHHRSPGVKEAVATAQIFRLKGEQVPTSNQRMTLSRLLRPSLLNITAGRSSSRILRQPLYQYQQALFRSSSIGKNKTEPAPAPATEHQQWIEQGIMDEDGLVNFDTLHNMQTRACTAYSQRNLFATYSTEAKQFQWMTYAECKFLAKKKERKCRRERILK
jgi:hypothetical protein